MTWFKKWFDTPYYHILYKDRDFSEAEAFLTLLLRDLQLSPYSKVIDLACGKGRHSLFLNQLGYRVLGLDLSEGSILHNRSYENEALHFRVHDMREPISTEPVDAVFNLFTSFGYFENQEEDLKVFRSVYDVLKPQGYFVLDFLNAEYVRKHLIPENIVEKEGIRFRISREIKESFVVKNINFQAHGQDFSFFEKVKLHSLEEIDELSHKAGFEKNKLYGDYSLAPFNLLESPRAISVFVKK